LGGFEGRELKKKEATKDPSRNRKKLNVMDNVPGKEGDLCNVMGKRPEILGARPWKKQQGKPCRPREETNGQGVQGRKPGNSREKIDLGGGPGTRCSRPFGR